MPTSGSPGQSADLSRHLPAAVCSLSLGKAGRGYSKNQTLGTLILPSVERREDLFVQTPPLRLEPDSTDDAHDLNGKTDSFQQSDKPAEAAA